jgi:Na+-translocating membrane potential-generating system MpsC-like protein
VDFSPRKNTPPVRLGQEALDRIAGTLSDLYRGLYEEQPIDSQASLTGNMLAFVFEGGLSVADEWLLRNGRDDRLGEFRQQFFEVVDHELVGVVADLTSLPVNYSFYGFDPRTRTTHAIFVLDLTKLDRSEERQAVLNWSGQVRRNARRLRAEHVATRETFLALKDKLKARQDQLRREVESEGESGRRSGD